MLAMSINAFAVGSAEFFSKTPAVKLSMLPDMSCLKINFHRGDRGRLVQKWCKGTIAVAANFCGRKYVILQEH
jgi:hypothetical protein